MSDAATIQKLPVTTDESRDVLEFLKAKGEIPPHILAMLEERAAIGEKKYGVRLQSFNGRDCLCDAKQEALDQIMYGGQAEMEGKSKGWIWKRAVQSVELIETLER